MTNPSRTETQIATFTGSTFRATATEIRTPAPEWSKHPGKLIPTSWRVDVYEGETLIGRRWPLTRRTALKQAEQYSQATEIR